MNVLPFITLSSHACCAFPAAPAHRPSGVSKLQEQHIRLPSVSLPSAAGTGQDSELGVRSASTLELAQRARLHPCWTSPCTGALVLNIDDWLGAWLGAAGGAFGRQPVAIQGCALHGWPGEAALSTLLGCGQEPEQCTALWLSQRGKYLHAIAYSHAQLTLCDCQLKVSMSPLQPKSAGQHHTDRCVWGAANRCCAQHPACTRHRNQHQQTLTLAA